MVLHVLPKVASMSPIPVQHSAAVVSWHMYYDLHVSAFLSHHQGQWRTEGGGGGLTPPPKFRSFDKVEPDCKLSRKCLVFLFQHPN